MATTANGYIARLDDSTPWSDEEWNAYAEEVKKVGNIIIGHRTYEMIKDSGDLERIGSPFTVVITSTNLQSDSQTLFVKTPEEALQAVEQNGFSSTTINGGSILLESFASKGLIDEVILDIEPFLFGKGIPLFKPNNFELELSLKKVKRIGNNTVQFHYVVNK